MAIHRMHRLNSGKFVISFPNESILILNGSVCRAFKIIRNDMKIVTFPLNYKAENPCFNFCVGVYVGGHLATNFLHQSTYAIQNENINGENLVPTMFSRFPFSKIRAL